jgi:hypothetical protein
MGIFEIFRSKPKPTGPLPNAFDSLAAICKFIAVSRIDPAFHQRHFHAIEMASAFLRVLAGHYPPLEKAFRASLPVPISDGSSQIHHAISELGLSDEKVRWLDAQMTEILKVLIPVVRDPDLPPWLSECKWTIEGAFHEG